MKQYALGLDFGTLSVRSLFLDIKTGQETATAVYQYPHGVMTECLPDGTPLPPNFALEHPQDFLDGLQQVVKEGMKQGGILPQQVVGIGLDVTSATLLPVDQAGVPLSDYPAFANRPHAWMKLWKHHGATDIARRMVQVASKRQEPWLEAYGGWISGELFMPKAVELAIHDPAVLEQAFTVIEASDWLVWRLTGELTRCKSTAGCNSLYRYDTGYPSEEYFKEVNPLAEKLPHKLVGRMVDLGECVGGLLPEMAKKLGLLPGTPVGAAFFDSHAAVIGAGAARVGDMVSVVGTSGCNMLNAQPGAGIPGMYSAAPDANIPGLFGYEGGQSCVGDGLAWFVEHCVPEAYFDAARQKGMTIHAYLRSKAEKLRPGESGLLALDWLNGVRSPLMDFDLTAVIAGLTIHTKPEEIYRALMEAAVFGNKRIIDTFQAAGKPVERIIAAGGIPQKDPLMMQILADVCDREIFLCQSNQASARGSAILGAAAAGRQVHGCKDIYELIEKLSDLSDVVYRPIPENVAKYRELYRLYRKLSEEMEKDDSVLRQLLQLKKGEEQ